MDVPILGQDTSNQSANDGPKIRLLFCNNCKTIDELPDYEGRPEDDYLLQIMVEKHQSNDVPHAGRLMKVPLALWVVPDIKDAIVKQIYEKLAPGFNALMPGFYETKSQFAQDAMTCYNQHLRPKGGCPDYGSDKKLLLPDTAKDRKELGLAPLKDSGAPKTYLCQFCPVHTFMVTQQRKKAGLYRG